MFRSKTTQPKLPFTDFPPSAPMRYRKIPDASGWWWNPRGSGVWVKFKVDAPDDVRICAAGLSVKYVPTDTADDERRWYGPWLRVPDDSL